jgi:hypothetical protein
MICADFLAGAKLVHGDPEKLLFSMTRFFNFYLKSSGRHLLEVTLARVAVRVDECNVDGLPNVAKFRQCSNCVLTGSSRAI